MIARIWSASFEETREHALRDFAMRRSLPYLRRQPGNQGVIYLARGAVWQTITLWRSEADYLSMEQKTDYRSLAAEIETLGLIEDVIAIDILDVVEIDVDGTEQPPGLTIGHTAGRSMPITGR